MLFKNVNKWIYRSNVRQWVAALHCMHTLPSPKLNSFENIIVL